MEDKVVLIPNKLSGVDKSEHSLLGILSGAFSFYQTRTSRRYAPLVLVPMPPYLSHNPLC